MSGGTGNDLIGGGARVGDLTGGAGADRIGTGVACILDSKVCDAAGADTIWGSTAVTA